MSGAKAFDQMVAFLKTQEGKTMTTRPVRQGDLAASRAYFEQLEQDKRRTRT